MKEPKFLSLSTIYSWPISVSKSSAHPQANGELKKIVQIQFFFTILVLFRPNTEFSQTKIVLNSFFLSEEIVVTSRK